MCHQSDRRCSTSARILIHMRRVLRLGRTSGMTALTHTRARGTARFARSSVPSGRRSWQRNPSCRELLPTSPRQGAKSRASSASSAALATSWTPSPPRSHGSPVIHPFRFGRPEGVCWRRGALLWMRPPGLASVHALPPPLQPRLHLARRSISRSTSLPPPPPRCPPSPGPQCCPRRQRMRHLASCCFMALRDRGRASLSQPCAAP